MIFKKRKITLTQEDLRSYVGELQTNKSLFLKPVMAVLTFVINRNLKKAEDFKSKLYKFNDIKLYNFIECLVNKDFTYLYRQKTKKRNKLAEMQVFEEMLLKYSESVGGVTAFQDMIDFYNTLAKIRILEASGNMLDAITPETKRILKRIGIKLTGDISSDIMQISGKLEHLKRIIGDIGNKLDESKQDAEKVMSFEYFSKAILAINRVIGLNCTLHTISLIEFCTHLKETQKTIAWQRKQSTK